MAFRSQTMLCILLCFAAAAESAKVTPMEKVIGLLQDLSAKVTAEGKKEAAQYDKFACFCKEQADDKLYNIEKSEAKIKDLSAEIKELDADIAKLSSEISDLSKKSSDLQNEIDRKTAKREREHAKYMIAATDMNEAIDACGAAIDALKDSKGSMQGAKVTNLLQVSPVLSKAPAAVALLAKLSGAPKFQYQSNDIIATIEDLQASFKESKKELDFTEHDINSAFEKDRLGLSNEKKFADKERAEKEAISEDKQETNQAAKEDRSDENDDMNADQTFLDEVTAKCENTAKLFDSRSQNRADELTALSKATTELKDGAVPNFGTNSKLVGLQLRRAAPASFVQIASVQHQKQKMNEVVFQRVREYLVRAADRTGSSALSAVAVRVQLAADHFVKVRGLIKDLIAKLKADAKAEATQKGNCDVGMANAISERDEANAKIEVANAKITTETSNVNALDDEMNSLTEQIAALKKELNEATELRNEDKADNEESIRQAAEGADAVTSALGLLKGFYEGQAFAQTGKYVPPKADRDGNTVADVAPEFASEGYNGAQAESKGIVGILEVILSDFERTESTTKTNEADADSAFKEMEKDTNGLVKEKNNRINKADGEKTDAEAEILAQQTALKDAKELLAGALENLEQLEATCVKGEETYEERAQKRKDEINALKETLEIFEDWQA